MNKYNTRFSLVDRVGEHRVTYPYASLEDCIQHLVGTIQFDLVARASKPDALPARREYVVIEHRAGGDVVLLTVGSSVYAQWREHE